MRKFITYMLSFALIFTMAFTMPVLAEDNKDLEDGYEFIVKDNQLEYQDEDWVELNGIPMTVKYKGETVDVDFGYDDDINEWCYLYKNEAMFTATLDDYNVGERNVQIEGIGQYEGSVSVPVTVTPIAVDPNKNNISGWDVDSMGEGLVYNGKYRKPVMNLYYDKYPGDECSEMQTSLVKGKDYDVISTKYVDNKYVGRGLIIETVQLKGNFSGIITVVEDFRIIPAKVSLTKKTVKKTSISLKFKSQKQISGYFVSYGYDSGKYKDIDDGDEDPNWIEKHKTFKANKDNKITLTKLKKNKKYEITVYAYKLVNGKKYYSEEKTYYIKTAK